MKELWTQRGTIALVTSIIFLTCKPGRDASGLREATCSCDILNIGSAWKTSVMYLVMVRGVRPGSGRCRHACYVSSQASFFSRSETHGGGDGITPSHSAV